MKTFKPTLAVAAELPKIYYPVYASPKLDGIRCSIVDGKALSRTLKPIPNKFVYAALSKSELNGLDGELIFGDPCSKSVYRDTNSAVMSHEGEPEITFYVFDNYLLDTPFKSRLDSLYIAEVSRFQVSGVKIKTLHQKLIYNEYTLLEYEEQCLDLGYEGLIIRSGNSPYKFGRSTLKEGYMLKIKRFLDSEAEITGIEEEMFNNNEALLNELGRTKRSTAQAGLIGKGTMGALVVKDVVTGVPFKIGTGFDKADRAKDWPIGAIVKYKYFPVGAKEIASGEITPRHPVYLGMRDRIDL